MRNTIERDEFRKHYYDWNGSLELYNNAAKVIKEQFKMVDDKITRPDGSLLTKSEIINVMIISGGIDRLRGVDILHLYEVHDAQQLKDVFRITDDEFYKELCIGLWEIVNDYPDEVSNCAV